MTEVREATTRRIAPGAAVRDSAAWQVAFDVQPGLARLGEGTTIVGRDPKAALRLAHPSVSRRHLALHVAGLELHLEDLGSLNGTLANRHAVCPHQRVPVRDGDVIEIGSVLALVQGPSASARVDTQATMARIHAIVDLVASGTIPITLVGETGVGKEVVAERIHRQSPRRDRPFVRINCAAVPDALLESELFGYERGAFTGAVRAKPGLFESAHGGTLLLDEVGELPLGIQAKLLRALDRKEVLRVGALQPRPADVRVVAATNRDLEALQGSGAFRPDLYFRLCGVLLVIPPLRERLGELPGLALALAEESARQLGRQVPHLEPAALRLLLDWSWPGNVRELRHVVDAAVLLAADGRVGPEQLPLRIRLRAPNSPAASLGAELRDVERRRIVEALERSAGNQSAAARALGISRRTLITRIESWGLPRPRKR